MTFFADEAISVATGDVKTLTRTNIDGEPGTSKASRAVISCFTADVAYRYGEDPITGTHEYHLLPAGSPLTIDGYDNLVSVKFKLASGSTTATLFVSYAR